MVTIFYDVTKISGYLLTLGRAGQKDSLVKLVEGKEVNTNFSLDTLGKKIESCKPVKTQIKLESFHDLFNELKTTSVFTGSGLSVKAQNVARTARNFLGKMVKTPEGQKLLSEILYVKFQDGGKEVIVNSGVLIARLTSTLDDILEGEKMRAHYRNEYIFSNEPETSKQPDSDDSEEEID